MTLILLGAAAALMQPSQPLDIAPAPPRQDRPASSSPQTRLPFETGQLVFTIRAWAGGATRCDARGVGASFEAAAGDFCSIASTVGQEGSTDGDPIVEVANVITLTRSGAAPAPLPQISGRTSFDAEAEVEVSPDGSVTACHLLQGERADGAAVELRPDSFCADMLRSPPSFQAWAGEGPRRGRARVTVFSSSPGSAGQPSGD